jgi:sugar phosphate isomerase/epimerase
MRPEVSVMYLQRAIAILRKHGFNGVLSVECGSPEEAARSFAHLTPLVAAKGTVGVS